MSANSDFGVAQDFLGQEEGDVKLYYVGALWLALHSLHK